MFKMPILYNDGTIQVGSCCGDTHEYSDGKFYISGMSYAGCYRYSCEPTPVMLEYLANYKAGTYFDASSENKNDWHHKCNGVFRARAWNRWLDEEVVPA